MNAELKQVLARPITTNQDIKMCFDYCSNILDLKEVISRIPSELGEFEILFTSEKEGYFMIQNIFESQGVLKSKIVSYDFYTNRED